jgi:hypothetical protein
MRCGAEQNGKFAVWSSWSGGSAIGRDGNIYEGVAGKRELGGNLPMTTDTVFAVFSTARPLP